MLESPAMRVAALVASGTLFVVCDVLAANWAKNNSVNSLYALLLLSPVAYVSFGILNQKYAFSIASAWIVLVVCTSSILLGLTAFGDVISARQGIGLALAVFSILLMML